MCQMLGITSKSSSAPHSWWQSMLTAPLYFQKPRILSKVGQTKTSEYIDWIYNTLGTQSAHDHTLHYFTLNSGKRHLFLPQATQILSHTPSQTPLHTTSQTPSHTPPRIHHDHTPQHKLPYTNPLTHVENQPRVLTMHDVIIHYQEIGREWQGNKRAFKLPCNTPG